MAVISSNTGGIPEVNIHGVSGFLSDVGDTDDMIKNALYILSDEERLKTFKNNARKEALKFDLHAIVPQYEKIYEDTLSRCLVL
ncbi:glycosyltransferase [Jejuia pallidilutea]|uniref:Glycosyltransferase n=1 Tax=Jejuia pallidilutea TaxID=504487 RepID=A0A090W271_9FLAO|nr:glycosyltransferase [Jejuia pallidilutea]